MISDGVAHELVVVARKLVDDDPEATFSDLLKAYFGHITGQDYNDVLDNPPDDETIIDYHLMNFMPRAIAAKLKDDRDYITWVLLTYGFSPNRSNIWNDKKMVVEHRHYERLVSDGIF